MSINQRENNDAQFVFDITVSDWDKLLNGLTSEKRRQLDTEMKELNEELVKALITEKDIGAA